MSRVDATPHKATPHSAKPVPPSTWDQVMRPWAGRSGSRNTGACMLVLPWAARWIGSPT